ncbi:hypothetical protein VC83_06378 [Pseudogymnoascus destructans]|uniref:Wax synthase domain-containing protein n=2 Tax=Pseudogymnoascus destructans TaxID=655981 RepID=L8GD13_PSED2|nr:uncharacterized protein VC83_06378 [Pseudogymnoascus destructans]ELR09976.1 hypothetical protein GMDG_00734 [Pseudogymnoascus destructans 20631-21]OAF58260.1 hypothetical protein VC83_06378 [Pseudogymnoascus destructans]
MVSLACSLLCTALSLSFLTAFVASLALVDHKTPGSFGDRLLLGSSSSSKASTNFTAQLSGQNASTDAILQGWVSGSEGRGTLDIIWSCLITIFLCSWTVLCLNVPPSRWNNARLQWQKFLMMGLGVLGPEFIFQLAIAQWTSACRSVKAFHSLGHDKWSMTHAFFADMGGFAFHTEDGVLFPLYSEQVLFLVKQGYVDASDVIVDKSVIQDKNKGDGMARFLTIFQILWFSINSIGRVIQHLAITTLELTTLGFIVCTLGTYFFWAHKPMDVSTAITLVPNISLDEIIQRAGLNSQTSYKRTPLDFVGRNEWTSWMLYYTYWMNILRKLGIVFHPNRRPIEKISDDYTPALSSSSLFILFVFHTSYAAVHISGWNFHFPSQIEATIWHVATITVMLAICGCWAVDMWTWQLWPSIKHLLSKPWGAADIIPLCSRGKEPTVYEETAQSSSVRRILSTSLARHTIWIRSCLSYPQTIIQTAASHLRNNSLDRDPDLTVPLKAILPITLFAASYTIARAYILIEDLVNLRSQPASTFKTVNWSDFLPHF